MNAKIKLITSSILIILFLISCDFNKKKEKIIGRWELQKSFQDDTFVSQVSPPFTKIIYEFTDKGTYETFDSNGFIKNKTMGKWVISLDKKYLIFFDNKFVPKIDNSFCADHHLEIVNLTDSTFAIKEFIWTEDKPGVQYFKRK
jgi:hypothetical protein